MKCFVFLAACFTFALGNECPKPTCVSSFKVNQFCGTWYQYMTTEKTLLPGIHGRCHKSHYTYKNETGVLVMVDTHIDLLSSKYIEQECTATLLEPGKSIANLLVTLKVDGVIKTTAVSVLATDYQNYAILYSCEKGLFKPSVTIRVMTRLAIYEGKDKFNLEALIKIAFINIEKETGVKQSSLGYEDHKGCEH